MAAVDAVVGAGVGATCIALSVAFQMIARKGGGGGGKHHGGGRSGGRLLSKLEMPRLHIALWIAGGLGLVGTRLGAWINTILSWCNEKVTGLMTEWVGIGLGWLVSGALVVLLICDIRDDKAEPRTLGIAAAAPFAVVAIPGSVGAGAAAVIAFVSTGIGGIVAGLFGLG
ncbi:hypothetical protein OHA79_52190 (plasmid) [Streptomyces sp. NBC_00841]|uniref:hypothetical protein n=1 Tax=Streptomyces sp. NBC_00841 TaxID=2975847 RepID=UPI002DDC55AC|nr:hypothetical protein [Streptomyces sp. NBC_00841]WSA06043.1 hypothetical protein OHA79_52190 [Streptomyces sp. NBC_00841]